MKRTFTILLSGLMFSGLTFAQDTIPNPGFESWSGGDPVSWSTLNSFSAGSATQATSAGDYHSGSSAVVLNTQNVVIQVAPGVVATGTLNFSSQEFSPDADFTGMPDSLVGWYKYTPSGNPGSGDKGTASAFLFRANQTDTVAKATFVTPASQPTFTRFAVAFEWLLQESPAKALFICTSGLQSGVTTGSKMYVDDLEAVYVPTVGTEEIVGNTIHTYPNPVVDYVYFDIHGDNEVKIELYNILGGKVEDATLTRTNNFMNLAHLTAGTYMFRLKDANSDKVLKAGRIVLTK